MQFVFRWANKFSVDPACSKMAQNRAEARNRTRMTTRCRRSRKDHLAPKKSQANMPSERSTRNRPMEEERPWAVIGWSIHFEIRKTLNPITEQNSAMKVSNGVVSHLARNSRNGRRAQMFPPQGELDYRYG